MRKLRRYERLQLKPLYNRLREQLESTGLSCYLEPFHHVAEVERLRLSFRPAGAVKLLLLAESHVRMGEDRFATKGAGFLYESRYYTPWWKHLLLPAMGKVEPTTAATRAALLLRLQACGVWILDASLLSLSGYRKVDARWPSRPLDIISGFIVRQSWTGYIGPTFERIMNQPQPPVICAFNSVLTLLPELRPICHCPLAFLGRSNSKVYAGPGYAFGTERFRLAVKEAGLEGCLTR